MWYDTPDLLLTFIVIIRFFVLLGAAGNFLAPIESLSENAFKTVINIDLVSHLFLKLCLCDSSLSTVGNV